jgi:hypothetical protein
MAGPVLMGIGAARLTAGDVRVLRRSDAAPCVDGAARELESTIGWARFHAGAGPAATVIVESLDQSALDPQRSRFESAVPAPAESFAIRRNGGRIMILGRDAVGAMYGAFEVREIVRRSGSLAAVADAVQQPFLAFRGVNQFLFEEALEDPRSWFYQPAFWEGYFALLAHSRHNVLDLHAGYNLVQTNFPNIFQYFVYLDEYPGQCVGRAAVQRNLAMLNQIIRIGRRHGVKVALMNYTVQGRPGLEKSDRFAGFDSGRLANYTYLASRALLRGCPDLWMYGFRIGESGQSEDFFQKTYLAAVADSGFRGKLYTRSWLATRNKLETIEHGFPGDFYIEVKYNGEELGAPYQAITSPTRFSSSYSYEAYTNLPRGFKLLYQVRANGTARIFHWGDSDFVARVVKSCRLGAAAGYSVEPMTAYYPMTDRYHPANGHHYFQWTWQRDWFWYELWGRLGYNPDLPRSVFSADFEGRFGSGGRLLYELLATASQVVPIIGAAITLGPDQRQWAPEFETGNPDFSNLSGLRAYGNLGDSLAVAPLDPTVMSSVAEAAAAEIADRSDGRIDPRATAGRLFAIADQIDALLGKTPAAVVNAEEAECLRLDAAALGALARFAGERYLAALDLAEYQLTSYPPALGGSEYHLRWAREHWRRLATIADTHYAPLLETLRMRTSAFRWSSQLPVIDGDLGYLATLERALDARQTSSAAAPLSHLPGRGAHVLDFLAADAAWPVQWKSSAFEAEDREGRPALRATTGRIAFDVEDLWLNNTDADLGFKISYWDPGPGVARSLRIEYDCVGRPYGTLKEGGTIRLGVKRGWVSARFTLNHARLAGGGPGYSDVVVSSSDGGQFTVQSPGLELLRAPAPHLDLQVADAAQRPPSEASIHWRSAGGPWTVSPLQAGIGERDLGPAVPRGREIYRFAIPAGLPAVEYYFTARWDDEERRLPAGDQRYLWQRHAQIDPPVIVAESLPDVPREAGRIAITARVTDPEGVKRVVLFYKPLPSQKKWQSVEMKLTANELYSASVPLTSEGLLYRFAAWDLAGNAALYPDFRVETPYRIIPSWDPASPTRSAPSISPR